MKGDDIISGYYVGGELYLGDSIHSKIFQIIEWDYGFSDILLSGHYKMNFLATQIISKKPVPESILIKCTPVLNLKEVDNGKKNIFWYFCK